MLISPATGITLVYYMLCVVCQPMMTELPSGEPLSVIFLDTEGTERYLLIFLRLFLSSLCSGFAASNISETYDAKIFSVATLLSSYLIYNSVKVRYKYKCYMCTC